jgi:F-type H+-transporting ATPase subunit a
MAKRIITSMLLILALFVAAPMSYAQEGENKATDNTPEEESLDVKEVIFHHLGDGYGWEVPFSHVNRIPLPVIVRAQDGTWHCFSSGDLTKVETVVGADGKEKHEAVPVVHQVTADGKVYQFLLAPEGAYANKVVQLTRLDEKELDRMSHQLDVDSIAKAEGIDADKVETDDVIEFDGVAYQVYRPLDLSITKNVLALFIAVILLIIVVMTLVRHYKKKGMKAPRKGMGFFEMLVAFVYDGVIKDTLKDKATKFGPYLLTCFFFILFMNLLGLIVIFPGGANLTGNIAVTLVLALLTFVVTNVCGNKHYWKEIFWPDVPIWLKCPLPIMQIIEVFGIFTKPAALCVRLFANMMGGHMIVITLTVLIFIFGAFGVAAASGSVVISVLFSIFMLALDVLVSFIQAYVFTMLSTIFISLAQPHHEEHPHAEKN